MTDRQGSKRELSRQQISSSRRGPGKTTVEALVSEMVDVGMVCPEDVFPEPKQVDSVLWESEEGFRAITESSTDYILILDVDLKVQFINRTEPGISKEGIIGTPLYNYVDVDDRDRVKGILQGVLDTSESARYESFYKRPDGGEVYFESVATPMFTKGSVTGLVVISRNISDRKRVEKDLSEKIRLIQTLLDNMPCVAILIRPVAREIVALNDAAIKSGAVCGKQCFITWAQRETACPFCLGPKAWESGEKQQLEIEWEGTWWDAHWVPISDDLYLHYAFDITERKQSDEKFQKQQYYLEKAQEIGKIGTWELDIKKNELIWTDENYRVFGVPIGTELTYEIFLNCVHPDDREYVDREWTAALHGKPYDIEHRIIVNGHIRWVREKAELEFDEQGDCIRGTGFAQDVTDHKRSQEELEEYRNHLEELVEKRTAELERTNQQLENEISERKQAEQAIRLSEEKFSKTFHASPDSVTLTLPDEDGVLLEVNEGFERLSGYSREEALGKSTIELNIWGQQDDRNTVLKGLTAKGRVQDYELSIRRKSGEIRQCLMSCELLDIESKPCLLAVIRDITEKKQSERALQEMALFAELNPAPVLRFDKEGVIVTSNPAAISILGEKARAGGNLKDAMCCCWDISIAERISSDEVITQECKIGDRYYQFVIRGISSLRVGQIYGSDITERRLLAVQQKEQLSLLSHMSRLTTAGELASSLAHELNQPLCSIATLSEGCKRFMSAGDDGRAEVIGGIEKICIQAERAGKIIRRMSEFVRKHEEHYLPVDLNEVICASIGLLESEAKKAGVTIQFDEEGGPWPVMADKIQIEQVLLNLLRNGIEAMEKVESNRRRLTIQVSVLEEGFVEISVIDKGNGLCEDDIEKVFEPFYTTKPSGMGIGLSISRSIIESHGGRLWAESVVDRGSTFRLILPVNSETESS